MRDIEIGRDVEPGGAFEDDFLDAVIAADNPERKLRQGMTAAVKVLTSQKEDVLRISNAALRWKPENAPAPAQQKFPVQFTLGNSYYSSDGSRVVRARDCETWSSLH